MLLFSCRARPVVKYTYLIWRKLILDLDWPIGIQYRNDPFRKKPLTISLCLCVVQGQYTKITFRTPLFLGGAPNAYWLVRAVGTNRGFQGCVQSLRVNSRVIDLRPWPKGNALSGADIGQLIRLVCFAHAENVYSHIHCCHCCILMHLVM